jgi:uncharacterized lipoprotein YajG
MKILSLAIVAAGFFLVGCGKNSKTANAINTISNTVDAPVNYLGAVMAAKTHSENVIDVSYINEDIQMFNASEGHYPKDLQEMVPEYLAKIPKMPFGYELVYDTNSYTVHALRTNSIAP